MGTRFEQAANIALALAAFAIGGAVLHREFVPPHTTKPRPVKVQRWENLGTSGVWIGDRNAPIRIVEFADLECPYCKVFHDSLSRILARSGGKVGVLFVHFPLPSHRFARQAANASMCADDQGAFSGFQDAVFANQDSLGLKTWQSYGVDAGIPDLSRFAQCLSQRADNPMVRRGIVVGDSLAVTITPTVIVNGWRYSVPPLDSLGTIVDAALRKGIQ